MPALQPRKHSRLVRAAMYVDQLPATDMQGWKDYLAGEARGFDPRTREGAISLLSAFVPGPRGARFDARRNAFVEGDGGHYLGDMDPGAIGAPFAYGGRPIKFFVDSRHAPPRPHRPQPVDHEPVPPTRAHQPREPLPQHMRATDREKLYMFDSLARLARAAKAKPKGKPAPKDRRGGV